MSSLLRRLAVLLALSGCGAASGSAPRDAVDTTSLEGDWVGISESPQDAMQVHIHLARGAGGWTSSVDLPSRSAWGVVATDVTAEGSRVAIDVRTPKDLPSMQGVHIVAEAAGPDRLRGQLTRSGQTSPVVFGRFSPAPPPEHGALERLAGRYAGRDDEVVLRAVGRHLMRVDRFAPVELFAAKDGTFRTTADEEARFGEASLRLGSHAPLARQPAPYTVRETTIRSSVSLRGSVFVPSSGDGARHPGVVLLSGSGPQPGYAGEADRVADHLARSGFAVLAYDKRGGGLSGGSYYGVSFEQLAADALAALEALRAEPGVDPARVGFWALSEGTRVAPIAIASTDHVAFVVLAAAAIQGSSAEGRERVERSVRADGGGQAEIDEAFAFLDLYENAARRGVVDAELEAAIAANRSKPWARYMPVMSRAREDIAPLLPRVIDSGNHDTLLRQLRCPVLGIWGEYDSVFPAALYRPRFEALVRSGGNQDVTTMVVPKASHPFFPSPTGAREELLRALRSDARVVFAPGYLENVTAWLKARTR